MTRETILRNVERALWAESLGYCMRPVCDVQLIQGSVNVSERAHIVPDAQGGPPTIDNLILLCRECHTIVDHTRNHDTVAQLKVWKRERNKTIRQYCAKRYDSYKELAAAVAPLLESNKGIFAAYGPDTGLTVQGDHYALWNLREPELITNNENLTIILQANKHLVHAENWEIIGNFIRHAEEFVITRSQPVARELLFPAKLPAIFGLLPYKSRKPPPNISALQNLVNQLQDEGTFVTLQLLPNPMLSFREHKKIKRLDLMNRPYMQQIYWSRRCFFPKTTELRLDSLLYFLSWLQRQGIEFQYGDSADLTSLTITNNYRIKLFYEYILTLQNLHTVTILPNTIVVNLFDWNGGKITPEALAYARQMEFRALTRKEFLEFAIRNLS